MRSSFFVNIRKHGKFFLAKGFQCELVELILHRTQVSGKESLYEEFFENKILLYVSHFQQFSQLVPVNSGNKPVIIDSAIKSALHYVAFYCLEALMIKIPTIFSVKSIKALSLSHKIERLSAGYFFSVSYFLTQMHGFETPWSLGIRYWNGPQLSPSEIQLECYEHC